jgi:hypothetical protein
MLPRTGPRPRPRPDASPLPPQDGQVPLRFGVPRPEHEDVAQGLFGGGPGPAFVQEDVAADDPRAQRLRRLGDHGE